MMTDNADAQVPQGQIQQILSLLGVWNGASWERMRTPNVFKVLNGTVISAETTIWTPAAGKKFRFMGFLLSQGIATGDIILKDGTGGATIFLIPHNAINASQVSPNIGNGILSATVNNVLTATGVSTETMNGVIFGTEE